MPSDPCLSAQEFSNYILTELPVYQDEILRDERPVDKFSQHISKAMWNPQEGVSQTQDRFRNVQANTAKKWETVTEESCADAPCDPLEHDIGWGTTRNTYGQERISYKTQLLCFDQLISATKAAEHLSYIISDILSPATYSISSSWVRRKNIEMAQVGLGKLLAADANLTPITWSWATTGDEQIFATPSAFPTSKLTPEMIQRQLSRLRLTGYFGKWTNDPFWGGYDNFAELITDDDTCWELDKLATNTRISDLWRFQQWNAAHEYYAYGMGGQIGNFMTHIDPFALRFNKKGSQLQYVPPFINEPTTVGIGSVPNPDYDLAQYQFSWIWHRFAWTMMVQQMESLNAKMPFTVRGLNGEWNFAMNDLGQDCKGNAIANYRGNKGFFWSDFRYAARPRYTEFLTGFLHLREPKVIYVVAPCAADPGYPTQNYNASNAGCDTTYIYTPDAAGNGHFVVAVNSTTCNDEPLANSAIDAADIAALIIALNADPALSLIGTWSAVGTDQIQVVDATCKPSIPWVVS